MQAAAPEATMTVVKQRTFDLHIVLWPDTEIRGRWMAHCLELDVLTWGTSVEHAVEMVREAAGMVLVDDLSKDRDPLLRRAPQEDWDSMWTRLRGARPQPLSEVANGRPEFIILESVVTMTAFTPTEFAALVAGAQQPPTPLEFSVPVAFTPAVHAA